jgi:hypothetical protein
VKHIVSVSLGSSKRDKRSEVLIAGEPFLIERVGTDGDLKRFQQLFAELDGKVDALGVGGADLYIWVGDRRYTFRSIQRLVSVATKTPVVDGSGLKNTLEREALRWIQAQRVVDFSRSTVLLVAAVDRFGMAQELAQLARRVIYGDLVFAVGLPIPIRSYRTVEFLGKLLLPMITRLPFQWFYPTGEKQEKRTPTRRTPVPCSRCDCRRLALHPSLYARPHSRQNGSSRTPCARQTSSFCVQRAQRESSQQRPIIEGRELRHECDGRGHRRAHGTTP